MPPRVPFPANLCSVCVYVFGSHHNGSSKTVNSEVYMGWPSHKMRRALHSSFACVTQAVTDSVTHIEQTDRTKRLHDYFH
eukprot:4424948-Amphidinium_carterae.1